MFVIFALFNLRAYPPGGAFGFVVIRFRQLGMAKRVLFQDFACMQLSKLWLPLRSGPRRVAPVQLAFSKQASGIGGDYSGLFKGRRYRPF